jgi:argininosuccinate lyase
MRGEVDAIALLLTDMEKSLVAVAAGNVDAVMPGFTYLQVAQPVSFAHHLLAYVEMFARDAERLAYNKDNQEDKEPLFDTVDTVKDTLRIMAEMIGGEVAADGSANPPRKGGLKVKREAMERAALKGYATATDLADYLVKKGLAFRDAHEVVAHAVKDAIALGQDLSELPLEKLQGYHPDISDDVHAALTLAGSLNARNTLGGTAPAQVRVQIERHLARLG